MDAPIEDLPIYAAPLEATARRWNKGLLTAGFLLTKASGIELGIMVNRIDPRFVSVAIAEAIVAAGFALGARDRS